MTISSTTTSTDGFSIETDEFGRLEVSTVPLPLDAQDTYATYTPTGSIFLLYRKDEDPAEQEIFHAAVIQDDGSDLRPIFSGTIPQHKGANGIRAMMFPDGKRVHLGDYILECTPDVDHAVSAELVDVHYPWELRDDPQTTHHWSEIIVSPDGEHMAWTLLRNDMGAAAAIGRLRRTADRYEIDEPRLISTVDPLIPDPGQEGFVLPQPMRGGEVKQFIRGGAALSIVGGVSGPLPDSVVQDLDGEELTSVTRTPGYDETTIFSPDETLGLVMTSRASRTTNPDVLGLLPRPHAMLSAAGISWIVYTYTVAGVRAHRPGNVGPVLIDIAASQQDPAYDGVSLHDRAEEWVYVSPMSWHPDGTRGLWLETPRGSEQSRAIRDIRIRRVRLLDRAPGEPVAPVPVPEHIPYAISGEAALEALRRPAEPVVRGRIAGRHSGYLEIERTAGDLALGKAGSSTARFVDYSDDGFSFYDGTESVTSSFTEDTVYEADLVLTGPVTGEMHLRATWSPIAGDEPSRLRFEEAPDGRPASYGYARYGDERREITDLVP